MNYSKFLMIILVNILIIVSCSSPSKRIKILNNYEESINNLNIGEINFGTITPNEETKFKSIEPGQHRIYGISESGRELTGTVTINENASSKFYSLIINQNGRLSIISE